MKNDLLIELLKINANKIILGSIYWNLSKTQIKCKRNEANTLF